MRTRAIVLTVVLITVGIVSVVAARPPSWKEGSEAVPQRETNVIACDETPYDPFTAAPMEPPPLVAIPTDVTISLEARKNEYFLGENILMDYRVSYKGDGTVTVGFGTGVDDNQLCAAVANNRAGDIVPQCRLKCSSGGHGGRVLRRGDTMTFTIPVMRYCAFEKPGRYRVRVIAHLGWSNDRSVAELETRPASDPRWAETTVDLVMPDADQARKVVTQMRGEARGVPERFYPKDGNRGVPDYADFSCLRYPVYLPILRELAEGREGYTNVLAGIANTRGPEATRELGRLLKHPDTAFVLNVAGALSERLPEPEEAVQRVRCIPNHIQDIDPQFGKDSWQAEFSVPVRDFATAAIRVKYPEWVRCGAFMLEAVGTANDMPAIISAIDATVPLAGTRGGFQDEEPLDPDCPMRQACEDLVFAAEAIAYRGALPLLEPRTSGEIVSYLAALRQQKKFRPKDWQELWRSWVRRGPAFVRQTALFRAVNPLPDELRQDFWSATREVIADSRNPSVIRLAADEALSRKFPPDQVLETLVDRLDTTPLFQYVYAFLNDIAQTGRAGDVRWECVAVPTAASLKTEKEAWKRFLKENGDRIRCGYRFSAFDIE